MGFTDSLEKMLRAKREEFEAGLRLLEADLAKLHPESMSAAAVRATIAWRQMQIEAVNVLLGETEERK
jgi:hypothetical protein